LTNDEKALEAAIRCNWGVAEDETRFVRIPNTLHLEYLYVSENLVEEALRNGAEVVEDASEIRFDEDGNLASFGIEEVERRTGAVPGPDDGYFAVT
jgi:hypothetical protein